MILALEVISVRNQAIALKTLNERYRDFATVTHLLANSTFLNLGPSPFAT